MDFWTSSAKTWWICDNYLEYSSAFCKERMRHQWHTKTVMLHLCSLPVILPRQFIFITQQVEFSGLLALPSGFADLKVHQGGLLDPMQQEASKHSFQGLASVQLQKRECKSIGQSVKFMWRQQTFRQRIEIDGGTLTSSQSNKKSPRKTKKS